ncbi:MAG: TetR/AcrR family transcriptional regulator [Candidatus Nanopelagicales bacterium]
MTTARSATGPKRRGQTPVVGRPRDDAIDTAVLAAALRRLAVSGLEGMSISAVAEDAGTTRAAVYRRWPTKLDLAVSAVAALAEVDPPTPTDDPYEDLVAELEHFRHCITDASALALAGVMLQDGVDPRFARRYREHLVRPRRTRIRSCLDRGVEAGLLDADADLDVAGSLPTGSWYAFALGGRPVPRDWARRAAALVWRACGGDPT